VRDVVLKCEELPLDPTPAGGVAMPGRERLAQLKGKLFTSNLT
jgi:hypothetical protein